MLKNTHPVCNWTVGDTCFYHEHWSDSIHKAIIVNIAGDTAYLNDITVKGNITQYLDCLFRTQSEANRALEAENNKQIEQYCARIHTVEDLVRFAFDETVSTAEEYTDMNARMAFAIKAKELLGIVLE
ncbi:MAG: hypothetical protein HDQ88_02370 [Clostridia bacterium]|nr:hypothetical protein [Clostridia bacterium]